MFRGHLELEKGVLICGDKIFLVLHVFQIEADHIASSVLYDWHFDAIGFLLSDLLLELHHFCLGLIADSHKLILDVLASSDVFHLEKRVTGALLLRSKGQSHQKLLLGIHRNFPLAVDAEGGLSEIISGDKTH